MVTPEQTKLIENLNYRKQRTGRFISFLRKSEARYPWLRLVTLLVGILLIYLSFQLINSLIGWFSVLITITSFALVASSHNRVIERIGRLSIFEKYLVSQIARIEIDWENIPNHTNTAVQLNHPFAFDLNIIGEKSIHQLIDNCVSVSSSNRLAGWLLEKRPDPERMIHRQKLVQELIELRGMRTQLFLDGQTVNPEPDHRWNTNLILNWLEGNSSNFSLFGILITLTTISAANIILFIMSVTGQIPSIWIGTMILYLALQALHFNKTSEVFNQAYTLGKQLGNLRNVLINLESYPFRTGSHLAFLTSVYNKNGLSPSKTLRRVSWTITASSLRNNPFLGLFLNMIVPWDVFFAYQLERVKKILSDVLPGWLDTWYEIEAISSIANFAQINPCYTFPGLLHEDITPILQLSSIGHPLIPANVRVYNDFIINSIGELILISGSNMSGKSTFLRTLGVNLILAYAGCPVAAREMHIIPFRVFTSMAINDSLSDGISYFYAEVRRLRFLLDELNTKSTFPLFFLIDEIFKGTNNRERELGSREYTRALVGNYGIGFISTHDLTLANLENESNLITNYHFKEVIVDGKMIFDYKIRSGASPTTNALQIMALAGLPVPQEGIP